MRSLRLLLVILSFSASVLAADSPFSGTWKFNPSKGHPTPPIPKSVVAHVEADAENFKFSQEGVDDKDQPFKSSYEAKFDGKEYTITGDPYSDSVSSTGERARNQVHYKKGWYAYLEARCCGFQRWTDYDR